MNTSTSTSNMSASIQQAIWENNEGTRFVRQCEYDAAVKSFTSVLKILKPLAEIVEDKSAAEGGIDNGNTINSKEIIASDASTSTTPLIISFQNKSMDTMNNTNDNDTTMTPSRTSSPSSSSSSSSPDTVASSSTTTSRKLKHFVFRDPIVIDDSSSYSPELLSKFLMIVMYNLALTLHLHALSLASTVSSSSNTKSSKSMKHKIKKLFVRSKKLYELTLQMHLEDNSSDDNDDPLFTLALTNNLGLIYRILKERVQSNTCFKNMFSTMMYLLDCNFDSHSIKEWDGLFSNAMDILFKHTYEVAAAAA